MFQIRDNKVYQLIRFTSSTALTLGVYSSEASAELAKERMKASSTMQDDCYYVIREWPLDDMQIPEATTGTSKIYVYEEKVTDVISTKPVFYCTVNGKHIVDPLTQVRMPFSDRVSAVCAGLLQLVPDNTPYIEARLVQYESGSYTLGELSFIREALSEFANSQNIILNIE